MEQNPVARAMGLQAIPAAYQEPPVPEGMEGDPLPAAKAGTQTENLLPDDKPQQNNQVEVRTDPPSDKEKFVGFETKVTGWPPQPSPSPAPAINPPPEKVSGSSPASVEAKSQQTGNKEFDNYCAAMSQFANQGYVYLHIQQMGNNPTVLPPILLWGIPDIMAFIDQVVATFRDKNFLAAAYPLLRILMTDNIQNYQWSAGVTITLAVFACLAKLGESAEA